MFTITLSTYIPISYGLDILLEAQTASEEDTGSGRSSFLTMINVAYVISPFLAGVILQSYGFPLLYSVSAVILLPFILLLAIYFKNFKTTLHKTINVLPTIHGVYKSNDLFNIFKIQFLIRFFFAWMVIYIPIYLTQNIGFSLSDMGLIFSVILIPFVLLEVPLGRYIDKYYGEKEFLIIGFVIMSLSSASLAFITTADFAMWMLALFITRVGAAIIEIMNEIYFFKHVDESDTDTISIFRMLSPLAYILGPATGSILLLIIPMQYMFVALGIVLLIGISSALKLHDTR